MDIISRIYHFDEQEFKKLLRKILKGERWLKVFLSDTHHGFTHGNQVRLACWKLMEKLNPGEKEKLSQAGKKICPSNSHQYAVVAVELAAIFHDCGRFNKDGQVVAKEQKSHHILSAKRARTFCEKIGLDIIVPDVVAAVLSHDFQSRALTPDLTPPKTIIGQIVQSSDQLGWFHPGSLSRTLDFSKTLGVSFYNPGLTLRERLNWRPETTKAVDALTVMLSQLFGPTDSKRFGIEFARKKVELYKIGLRNSIIKIAEQYGRKSEAEILIKAFQKRHA